MVCEIAFKAHLVREKTPNQEDFARWARELPFGES
jgi:hypothetical protein